MIRKISAGLPGALVLVAGIAAASWAMQPLADAKKALRAQAPPLFFPSARTVRLIAFGHQVTLADALYLWSIQYFGDPSVEIRDRRGWLVRVYDTITDLDPRFRDAYWLGFVSLLVEAQSPDDAFAMADKALRNDPGFTWMAIEAAMTARLLGRDDVMLAYLRQGSASGDPMARRFLARLQALDWAQDEMRAWRDLEDEKDELTRAIARSHVRDLTVLIDTTVLSALARCHQRERGLAPGQLGQLVTTGYLSELPLDPEGKPYLYDPRTLSVTSSTPFRHSPPSRSRFGVNLEMLGRCAASTPPGQAASAAQAAAP